jgi:hypothetical protein
MNQPLIRSEGSLIRSDNPDEPQESFCTGLTQPPPPIGEQPAADRTSAARDFSRGLQALRPPKLPLCRWTRTWSEALSVDQPAWWATTTGLRTQRRAYEVAQLIDNFRKLREMLNEICAINAELLRRREELG